MSTPIRPLLLLAALAATACSGSSAPPPPAASPTPAAAGDDLRPLSSRETGSPAALPPGHPPIGGAAAESAPTTAAHPSGRITGTIVLSPGLKAAPSDVLYVMAKKGSTTLAVRRIEAPSFPLAFEISGDDAMMSGVAFEGPVDLVARLSRSGDAIPAKGDLEGTTRNVKVPAKGVSVTIDRTRE